MKAAAPYPLPIDARKTFDALAKSIHDEIVVGRKAPGLLVGISGTDSLVAFLAAAKAFEMAGLPDRVAAIHFAPSEDYLIKFPEGTSHNWFKDKVVPWLRAQLPLVPEKNIIVDSTVDFRFDGRRWGALMDWSVFGSFDSLVMLPPNQRFWLTGTMNATEKALLTVSNASMQVSVQPLSHLWKSDILAIAKELNVPQKAIDQSCEADCVCGRGNLAAKHIAEVDWILQVRLGLLASDYLDNISPFVRRDLENYVNNQIQQASFKKEIPYTLSHAKTFESADLDLRSKQAALQAVKSGDPGDFAFAHFVPEVIEKKQADLAAYLVSASVPHLETWLPEVLTLFNTPGLKPGQRRQMINSIFGQVRAGDALARASARIGNYGYSFPQWRLLTQRLGKSPALAQQFGMIALERITDYRDPKLPASDPARDELGRGFVFRDSNWYVEYRRAYIVVSKLQGADTASLVIRNNSHYFGRDRLKSAVYFSFAPQTTEELEALTAESLATSGLYFRWQELLRVEDQIQAEQKAQRLAALLDRLDEFNAQLSDWMNSAQGSLPLQALFEHQLKERGVGGRVPFYLGVVRANAPSWSPRHSVAVTWELLEAFRKTHDFKSLAPELTPGEKVVFMAGARGDIP